MRVFGCFRQPRDPQSYEAAGMVIACGESLEDAYSAFINDIKYIPLHDLSKGRYTDECSAYPISKWFQMSQLTANCNKAKVLYEDSIEKQYR